MDEETLAGYNNIYEYFPRRERTAFFDVLPEALGAPTHMFIRCGRVVIETKSGVPFIAPVLRE